jgi:cholesterol oxidase
MFNLWDFDKLQAIVSSGLGGGSLIYANVLLRKDPKWFVRDGYRGGVYEYWPVTYEDLVPHYEAAEKMLKATPFPFDKAPYDATWKTRAFKRAAERLGQQWILPNLAVTFGSDPSRPSPGELIAEAKPNYHGSNNRLTCRLCGECDVGCNSGSKNSLDYNYITEAWRLKADIRVRSEVRRIRPRQGGGYEVDYVVHEAEREGLPTETQKLPVKTVSASQLVLSAGTLGTTYLLLKNAPGLPGISPTLGSRFCGNGDFIAFAYRCTESIDGHRVARRLAPDKAPVITSTMRVEDEADGGVGRGFYLQDAGYPEWINWLVETLNAGSQVKHLAEFGLRRVVARITRDPKSDVSAAISSLIGNGGASTGSMPLLGMGRDSPDGRMFLDEQKGQKFLQLDWHDTLASDYFDRVRKLSREVSAAMGGKYVENPLSAHFNQSVTVHPLGGAPMGRNAQEGVVDSHGRVFGWPGLYVADGSVMPGPVGANPSLTIAALADRFADNLIATAKRSASKSSARRETTI